MKSKSNHMISEYSNNNYFSKNTLRNYVHLGPLIKVKDSIKTNYYKKILEILI